MPLYHPRKPSRSFGVAPNYNPQTGRFEEVGDASVLTELTILEVGHDMLTCLDRESRFVFVAKAWQFRRTEFDGVTRAGRVYASTGLDTRTATDVDADEVTSDVAPETVTPAYDVGEKIVCGHLKDTILCSVEEGEFEDDYEGGIKVGDYYLKWIDLNSAGRQWEVPGLGRALLKTNRADGNLLDCQFIDVDGAEIGAVVVARNDALQAVFYLNGGAAWGGHTYTKTDKDTRVSDGTETQEVTLDYVEDKTILLLARIPGGAGITDPVSGLAVNWMDVTPGRSWAKE